MKDRKYICDLNLSIPIRERLNRELSRREAFREQCAPIIVSKKEMTG